MTGCAVCLWAVSLSVVLAQEAPRAALPALPAPMGLPKPGPVTDAPYAPQPILQGGIVVPLYPPGSPFLKADRVREAEQYNMSQTVAGRINSIVNIHNPSIEVHLVDKSLNTGAVVILAAGGGLGLRLDAGGAGSTVGGVGKNSGPLCPQPASAATATMSAARPCLASAA